MELDEEREGRWGGVDEGERRQPVRAGGRIREIGSGVRLDARGIEARHGSVQSPSERGRKRPAVGSRAQRSVRVRRLGPDRTGKMAIAPMARNHVPMQMLRDVTEARKVDLGG